MTAHRLLLRDTEAPRFARSMAQHGKAAIVRVLDPPPEYRENASIPGHYGTWWHGWNLDMPEGRKAVVDNGLAPIRPGACWIAETHTIESNYANGELFEADPPHNDGRPVEWLETESGAKYWRQAHYKATDPPPDLCCESETCGACEENGYGPHWRSPATMPRRLSRWDGLTATVRVCRWEAVNDDEALALTYEGFEALNITDPRAWVAVAEIGAEE